MFKNNRNLFVISFIAVVNALGYAIIIPILYSYSLKYGLSDFQNGLLFSIFSICQFLSTPVIGRLSDKYGRKPLLLISLAGTSLSFLMMAFAPSALFLFIARALDGITAGNVPVASAVISDTTEPKDRAKGFGIIGASFGFGFVFGPAISAFTLMWGDGMPFLIAAFISLIAVILTALLLPETNKHIGVATAHGKLFDFPKLAKALFDQNVGLTLFISFIYSFAFGIFMFAFQPLAIKILSFSAQQISILYTIYGIIGVVAQAVLIPMISRSFGERKAFSGALFTITITFLLFYFVRSLPLFILVSIFHGLGNAFVNPLLQTLLSREVDAKSQGEILGVNASYISLGMIFGPIIGGALATITIPLPLLVGSVSCLVCFFISFRILVKPHAKVLHLE